LRERQLALVAASQPGPMPALIVGDLNFDADADPEESGLPADFLDCWRRLHPADAGKTLDPDANALRAELTRLSRKHRRAMRCDRILLRAGPSDLWRPVEIGLVGTAPVASGADVLASDHFGLIATIDCNPHTTPAPR
jgi:endonuclease/exonuclease/phosphatase family metal-dependent hydrolase